MFDSVFTRKGLSLERLRSFCEVAQAGSIAQAVEDTHRKQPSYSRDIAELERYFESPLFARTLGRTRSGKRMAGLTAQGRALFAATNDIFRRLDECREFNEIPSHIDIGGGETVMQWIVGAHLPALTAALKTTLDLTNYANQHDALLALQDGRLDYAIVEESAVAAASFPAQARTLATLTFTLYIHSDWLRSTSPQARARLLSRVPWIALRDMRQPAAAAVADMKNAGIAVHLAATLSTFRQTETALRGRKLAAFLPTIADRDMRAMGFQKIEHPALQHVTVPLSLLYNEDRQPQRPFLPAVAETLVRIMAPLDAAARNEA